MSDEPPNNDFWKRRLTPAGDPWEDLAHLVGDLETVGWKLRRLGAFALVASMANVALGTIGIAMQSEEAIAVELNPLVPLLVGTCAAAAVLLLVQFDALRRRGDDLFQEVSEEMQYMLQSSQDAAGAWGRPPIELRLQIRAFASAASLPLFPGRSGSGILAALNIVIAITTITLYMVLNPWSS